MKKYKYLHHNPTKNVVEECLYACEKPISGEYIVRVQNGNVNNYVLFKSLGDYVDAFPPHIPHNTHEIIPEFWPQKPKFDLDGGTESHHDTIIQCIDAAFTEEYELTDAKLLIIESDFPGNTKLSKHIIISNYSFENSREAAAFTEKVLASVREMVGDDLDMVACIDAGVNKPNQSFRMPLATNLKGRKLIIPLGHEFHEGVVTFTEFTRRLKPLVVDPNIKQGAGEIDNAIIDNVSADLAAFNINPNIFASQEIKGNMSIYKRIGESYCNLCERNHDAGGNGIFFITLKREIRQYCYANKEKKYNTLARVQTYTSFQEVRQELHQRKYDTIEAGCIEVINSIKPFVMIYEMGITMVALRIKGGIRLLEYGVFLAKECIAYIQIGEKKLKFTTIVRNNERKLFYSGGLVFNPSLLFPSPSNTINLFTGFAVSPRENHVLIEPILDHILTIFANRDTTIYEYILDWFAAVIQGQKIGTAMVLYSKKQGAGKNVITDFLLKIIGPQHSTSCNDLDTLLSKFNGKYAYKNLTVVNEANNIEGSGYNKAFDKVKDIITSNTITVEKKGIDSTDVDDFNNYIFTTNNERPVKIDIGDRRYTMLQLNEERVGDEGYFNNLFDLTKNPDAAAAMMFLLINRQITHNIHKPLITEWKQNLQDLHKRIDYVVLFINDCEYTMAEQISDCVFKDYTDFCDLSRAKTSLCMQKLSAQLIFHKFIEAETGRKTIAGKRYTTWKIRAEYIKPQIK